MTPSREAVANPSRARAEDGRDHLNLAEHPISVLPRRQPVDEQGRKQDEVTYSSTRYDPVLKRRVPRSVTLTTNSRLGLPTPADESVLLALLYVARQANGFSDAKVHFTPHELLVLMGWSTNSRSYDRFREVLERLSALRLIYRNAWWDSQKRGFETEFSTGIIASYKLVRQKTGRRRAGSTPPSWIVWNPNFFESLQSGAVKRLNLKQVFALRLPTSQQMYRFLDKHFFYRQQLELDLREFACGHVGLAESYDTGELKRKLRPAIAELQSIHFIEPAEERFRKLKPGMWRVQFKKQEKQLPAGDDSPQRGTAPLAAALVARGVTPAVAARLAADHPPDFIRHKLDVLDYLLHQHHPSVSTNPAGFLVQSIRQNYSDPPRYRPEIPRKSPERKRPATTKPNEPPQDAIRRQLARKIDDHLASLSAGERTALEQAALDSADAPPARMLRQARTPALQRALRRAILRRHVEKQLRGQTDSPPTEGGELSANRSGRERL